MRGSHNYVIVRGSNSGVWAGTLDYQDSDFVRLKNARKIWFWSGAAGLSQLAMEGTKDPDGCRFPCEVEQVDVLDVVEILYCTEQAKESIKGVKVWQAT